MAENTYLLTSVRVSNSSYYIKCCECSVMYRYLNSIIWNTVAGCWHSSCANSDCSTNHGADCDHRDTQPQLSLSHTDSKNGHSLDPQLLLNSLKYWYAHISSRDWRINVQF